MTREEYLDLEQSIIERGRAIDPFTVWDGIVLDGVYRYEICLKHGLDFGYNEIDLPDREAAKRWRVDAILARRHLNTFRRIELVEKTRSLYEAEAKKRQGTRNDLKDSGKKFRESSNGGRPVDFKPDDEKDVHRAYSQDADRMTDSAADPQIEKKDKKKLQRSNETVVQLAKRAHTNETTYRQARFVKEHGSEEMLKSLRDGELTIWKA